MNLCFNLTNLVVFGLHLMANPHPGDRASGKYRMNQPVSLFVSPGETELNRRYGHICATVTSISIGLGEIPLATLDA